jgi:hypothetical protein
VGAIHLRGGDPARATEVLQAVPTGESRFVVPLTTSFLYLALAEQQQGHDRAAAALVRIAQGFMKRLPQLEHRKTGILWFEYLGQHILLREYQQLLNKKNPD